MALEITLITLGAVCLAIGIIGSVLPGLAGPPFSYVGLVLLHLTDSVQFTAGQLIFWLALVALTIIADYAMPVLGVKTWHGTKWGNVGCIVGTVVGIFLFPPWGIVFGPFFGAFVGEIVFAGKEAPDALKAGFGAFVGFLFGTIFKLSVCGWFVFCFIRALV